MAQWRETYKPARFFMLDARAGVPLLATLLHFRPWTLGISLAVVVVFWLLERRGLSVPSALRALRAWAIGDARPRLPAHKLRGRIDYERRFDENSERITAPIRPSTKSKVQPVASVKGKTVR